MLNDIFIVFIMPLLIIGGLGLMMLSIVVVWNVLFVWTDKNYWERHYNGGIKTNHMYKFKD